MSIDNAVPTGAPKVAQATGAPSATKKAAAGPAEPGGFAALLMSLGSEDMAPDEAVAKDAKDDDATAAKPDASADAAVPTDATLAGQLPPVPAEPNAAGHARAVAEGGVAALAAMRGRAEAQAGSPDLAEATAQAGGKKQALTREQLLQRQAGQQRLTQQSGDELADAQKTQRGEGLAARRGKPQPGEAQILVSAKDVTPMKEMAPQALLAGALGEAGLRPLLDSHRDNKPGVRADGVGGAAWTGVGPMDGGARLGADVPTVAPDGGLTTEMRVAEQVSYYMGLGAQNAKLEIDGIDERPIHVNIDLQGQEARVEFRAEQPQTRQVLQDAMPHLRDMLERQGITLAGMSVSQSGPQERRGQAADREAGRPGPRQMARVAALAEVPGGATGGAAGGVSRAALPAGRSLDLFV